MSNHRIKDVEELLGCSNSTANNIAHGIADVLGEPLRRDSRLGYVVPDAVWRELEYMAEVHQRDGVPHKTLLDLLRKGQRYSTADANGLPTMKRVLDSNYELIVTIARLREESREEIESLRATVMVLVKEIAELKVQVGQLSNSQQPQQPTLPSPPAAAKTPSSPPDLPTVVLARPPVSVPPAVKLTPVAHPAPALPAVKEEKNEEPRRTGLFDFLKR